MKRYKIPVIKSTNREGVMCNVGDIVNNIVVTVRGDIG